MRQVRGPRADLKILQVPLVTPTAVGVQLLFRVTVGVKDVAPTVDFIIEKETLLRLQLQGAIAPPRSEPRRCGQVRCADLDADFQRIFPTFYRIF